MPHRLYTRYAFAAAAKIIDTSGQESPAEVSNISVGGCRLITSVRFPVGTQITIEIQVATDCFEAPAKVVHCAEDGLGVMFHNESPQSLRVLGKWIQKAIAQVDVNEESGKKPYVLPRVTEYKPNDVPAWAKTLKDSADDEVRVPHISRRDKVTTAIPKRILVADDDTSVRAIVCRGLEHRLGLICEQAENGLDAVAKVKKLKIDLVILDLAMPVMNGFEAAMILQREVPKIPVVILSMYAHEHFGATLAKTFGVKAIIPKAEGMSSLIQCIEKLVGS